jgi:hypothetical protein
MGRKALPPDQRKPRLSGAQRRRREHEREEKAARATARAKARGGGRGNAESDTAPAPLDEDDSWAQEFEEAGEPDLANPDTDLDYVRKLQLIVMRQMATTARPSKPQQDAWRRIREMSAVVGMTANRAKLEAEVRSLKKMLSQYQQMGGAIKLEKGSDVPRSPTARGRRRGPRLLPPEQPPPMIS